MEACKHEVEDIHALDVNNITDKILLEETKYKFRGTCILCERSIVAEKKSEYKR
jgi:hypothetical protein